MQKDPKEAMRRFQGDPEVGLFLHEFSKVMASHFEALGAQQEAQKKAEQGGSRPVVEEIGPLQAQAIQKQKNANATKEVVPVSSKDKAKANKQPTPQEEETRVQQVCVLYVCECVYVCHNLSLSLSLSPCRYWLIQNCVTY